MSFAATLGLVALVEHGMPKLLATPDSGHVARLALWGGREIAVLLLASLIAGLATTPFAAYHFHRITPYGVLANLAAMPVVSIVVMPAGLLGLAAMPFGLDGPFWRLMELGIDWMIAVSQWVAALPGAIGRVRSFGTGPLLAMSAGMIAFALLRTPLRVLGAAILAVGVVWAALAPVPDVLVSASGDSVAVRASDGNFRAMRSGTDTFVLREWLAADADARGATDKSLMEGVTCDAAGCTARDASGRIVALVRQPSALVDDCKNAALIVTQRQPPQGCAAAVVGRTVLQARGALALKAKGDGFAVEATRPPGTDRPWARALGGAGFADVLPVPSTTPRDANPREATPRASDLQADD